MISNLSDVTSTNQDQTDIKSYDRELSNINNEGCLESSQIKKHKLTHSAARPYGCELCDKKFTTSSFLKRHMKTHSGEKNICML